MTETSDRRLQHRLHEIWQRSQPQMLDRLAVLEHAAQAAAEDRLNQQLRQDASSIAHKLAGSLGMFGFAEGTRLAREIEAALNTGDALPVALGALTLQLRHQIAAADGQPPAQLKAS